MPKRRSLKDAATDPLVGKDRLRHAPAAAPVQGLKPSAAVRSSNRPKSVPSPAAPPATAAAASPRPPRRPGLGPLARMAVSVLIGFIGGILFGRFLRIG